MSLAHTRAWIETVCARAPIAGRAGRSLTRGRGLKHVDAIACGDAQLRRSLTRGRGLKRRSTSVTLTPGHRRSLTRGRGLKLLRSWRALRMLARSLAHTRAWIETCASHATSSAAHRRSLTRGRGLKPLCNVGAAPIARSLAHTRAWIETPSRHATGSRSACRSLTRGRGLKPSRRRDPRPCTIVARSHAGVD